jgi:hypothetical protein
MHRVYNSAFMNMMRDEKNAEYRQLIKNTLEFDPQILKRYVNFMNNPDERTAVEQFGKGDKYFGICTVMATLPGLPMFGHGQIEGYTEKYGMEYRRAYWDEHPDQWLVERHERQVFPILHRRYLFAEVESFLLYDFYTAEGHVDENVFAYSNRTNGERSLVLYHNRYAETSGWVRTSAAYAVKSADGEKTLVQKTLAEGLGISSAPDSYLIFRDALTNLEYIRSCQDLCERGLYAELHAYQGHVFVDFREVHENRWGQYGQLNAALNGRGVPSIAEALKELFLAPVHTPLRMLVSAPAFRWLLEARITEPGGAVDPHVLEQVEQKMLDLLRAIKSVTQGQGDEVAIARAVRDKLEIILALPARLPTPEITETLMPELGGDKTAVWGTLFSWLFTHALGQMVAEEDARELSRSWLDEWLLGKLIANALHDLGLDEDTVWRAVTTIKLLLSAPDWLNGDAPEKERAYRLLRVALRVSEVQAYLGINRHQDILWFNQESFEMFLWWSTLLVTVETLADEEAAVAETLAAHCALLERLREAEATSGYQVMRLLEAAL